MKLTAIVGGIGAGKSVVCRSLAAMGYPVYDCDSRAKAIMDNDSEIHNRLLCEIHPECVVNGIIDRRLISEIVFSDPQMLERLNAIVHFAVKSDLQAWSKICETNGRDVVFVETAILRQSGLIDVVDDIWEVTAPTDVRIKRVVQRNGLTEEQVYARIESQKNESLCGIDHKVIVNDDTAALLPQIHSLLSEL